MQVTPPKFTLRCIAVDLLSLDGSNVNRVLRRIASGRQFRKFQPK
jgi:hypothetical protein